MQDIKSYSDLKEKSLEIILNYKPSEKHEKATSDELQKLKNDVKRAIALLPKDKKDIIELRYYQNLSSEQIAQKIEKSQDEVNKIILQAIDEIKTNLKTNLIKNTQTPNFPEISKIKPNENLKSTPLPSTNSSYFAGFITMAIFVGIIFFGGYFLLQKLGYEKRKSFGSKISLNITNQSQTKNLNKIKISGSTSVFLLARRWQNAFKTNLPKYQIELISSDSNQGILSLIDGKINIASSSRPVSYADEQLASKREIELIEHRVALDALVIIVNSKNPVEEISLDTLENLFNNVINNWNSLGGFNEAILPVVREKGSGTNGFVINRILQGNDFSSKILRKNSNEEIIKLISENTNAIGFINSTSYPWDNKEIKYLKVKNYEDSVSYSPFEGQKLNEQSIRYGDYPLSHYLYFVTTNESQKCVKDFIRWILGPKGQSIVRYSGLIPVKHDT